jgi:chromosome partitioning protein
VGLAENPLALAEALKDEAYDLTLLDVPPSLSPLTLNALGAAQGVIVPVQAEYYALEGVAGLLSTLEEVRSRLNPALRLLGILITMYPTFRTPLTPGGNIAVPPAGAPRSRDGGPG